MVQWLGSNIDKSCKFDRYFQASIDAQFGGGSPVFVQLTQEFNALADGGGSYAELNFKEANANAIRQPVLYMNGPWLEILKVKFEYRK